jgi:two-component SAPR family response regulator
MSALNVLDSDRQIDFIIADIIMPEGQPNGLAFARIARMKRLGIKVAFITGYTNLALSDNTLPARVFYKPIDLEDLVAEIDTQLWA